VMLDSRRGMRILRPGAVRRCPKNAAVVEW
jgi:hypothetical protein